jgi:hypothetical protein
MGHFGRFRVFGFFLFGCIDLLQAIQNQSEELVGVRPLKPPPHMCLACAADDYLPGVPGKPRKLIGGRADEVQAADHAKTTDFEYDTTGVCKSMAVGTVDRDSFAWSGQPLPALPADNPAIFFGGSSAAVSLAVRLLKGLPFAVGSQGIGRNKSLPEHGRPSSWISLLKKRNCSYQILRHFKPRPPVL